MINKISFIPMNKFTDIVLDIPKPSSHSIPDWYKKIPLEADGYKNIGLNDFNSKASTLTLKGCTPLLDAFTAGYMVTLPSDLEVKKTKEGELYFNWRVEGNVVSMHTKDQHPGLPKIVNNQDSVIKFGFSFTIRTPKNYSCLFTHPLNRHDLPFRTFSGIVDTDEYPQEVQFPFQLNKEITEPMIIEKGTPICQIIPFKREGWKSEKQEYDENFVMKSRFDFASKIIRSYKNQYWSKKTYL
jgi:hypothetical protein